MFLLMSLCNPCFCISVYFMGSMVLHLRLKQSPKEMMGFILFWIHQQHFFSKERSDTCPRVRINYPFPSQFKICFRFCISFIVWNWYLHAISIAFLAISLSIDSLSDKSLFKDSLSNDGTLLSIKWITCCATFCTSDW